MLMVVDIGGTFIRIGAIDEGGTTPPQGIRRIFTASLDGPDAVTALASVLLECMSLHRLQPVGCVLGVPASFDEAMDEIIRCHNIPTFEGRKLKSELQELLGIPVCLERDTMLSLLGEASCLDLSGDPTSLGVFFGTGIGGDVLLNNRPYRLPYSGFELGHIPIEVDGKQCVCGSRGCAEAYANGFLIDEIALRHDIDYEDVFTYWQDGSELAASLQRIVEVEALVVASAITLFNPLWVVIGGGIVAMGGYPRRYFADLVKSLLREPYPAQTARLVWASLGPDAPLVGARVRYALARC